MKSVRDHCPYQILFTKVFYIKSMAVFKDTEKAWLFDFMTNSHTFFDPSLGEIPFLQN